ncbi:MAG: DUF3800 domain-containing protein [Phycisphaerae bacterium]
MITPPTLPPSPANSEVAGAPLLPPIPRVVIYCDESCHDLTAHHAWMAIGGLRMSRDRKPELARELRKLCEARGLRGEIKWKKVSASCLEGYKSFVDFFFAHAELRFRAIIVEQAKIKMERHGRDRELCFYKFYYEMLEKWIEPPADYLILLDQKQNRDADRFSTLRTYLARRVRGTSWIADLTVINSHESRLAQLCDLLTGAVAAAYNGTKEGGPKQALAAYVAAKAGFSTLRTSTALTAQKFNLFRIELG